MNASSGVPLHTNQTGITCGDNPTPQICPLISKPASAGWVSGGGMWRTSHVAASSPFGELPSEMPMCRSAGRKPSLMASDRSHAPPGYSALEYAYRGQVPRWMRFSFGSAPARTAQASLATPSLPNWALLKRSDSSTFKLRGAERRASVAPRRLAGRLQSGGRLAGGAGVAMWLTCEHDQPVA